MQQTEGGRKRVAPTLTPADRTAAAAAAAAA